MLELGSLAASVQVCKNGYHWEKPSRKSKSGADMLLYCGASAAEQMKSTADDYRYYDPFRVAPALFLEFAQLGTPGEMLEFADRYGDFIPDLIEPSLAEATSSVEDMRHAVDLWRATEARDRKSLQRHVRWVGGQLEYPTPLGDGYWPDEPALWIDGEPVPFADFCAAKQFRKGSLIRPAQALLDWVIETRAFTSLFLRPVRSATGALTVKLVATQLRDVMWLQFARAVVESAEFRECSSCGRPFELSPEVNRADRTFCSDACRVRAYRQRKAAARKLRKAGKTLPQIAKQVGADVQSVKGWVEGIKKGGA